MNNMNNISKHLLTSEVSKKCYREVLRILRAEEAFVRTEVIQKPHAEINNIVQGNGTISDASLKFWIMLELSEIKTKNDVVAFKTLYGRCVNSFGDKIGEE